MQVPYSYPAAELLLAAVLLAGSVEGQTRGPLAGFGIHPTNVFSAFSLPALPDAAGSTLATTVAGLQVGTRANALGLSDTSATTAWQAAQTLLSERQSIPVAALAGKQVVFSGSTASALNQIVANAAVSGIHVTSPTLSVDQPIEIQRADLALNLGSTQIVGGNPQSYMLRVENTSNVTVTGGSFVSGDSAILISSSSLISIKNVQISNLTGAGILATNSMRLDIEGNNITGIGLAAIMLHLGTTQSIVEKNRIANCVGFSNVSAGIVLTDRAVDLTSNPRAIFGPDGYWVITQPMMERLNPPHDNVIALNSVARGLSSGIYSDGSVRNTFFANAIEGDSKEGLCLDNGSTADVVISNIIHDNGERWGDPDWVLAEDSVLAGGRLPNGTAAEKVPGISLDNAIYSIVLENDLAHNFGGGVKMVRTGYFNAIGLNNVLDNNDGAGPGKHSVCRFIANPKRQVPGHRSRW